MILKEYTWTVTHAGFSPDGQRVVTVSRDKTARVWNVGWKSLLTTLRGRTTGCLTKAQGVRYLFENDQAAKAGYEAYERRYGRLI